MNRKLADLIIISILWIVSIISIIMVIIKPYQIGIKNYIGYLLLLVISILRFYKLRRTNTLLGIILIIGSFNLVQFTYFEQGIFFNLSWPIFGKTFELSGIQPLSFVLLLVLIFSNFGRVRDMLGDIFSEDPKLAKENQERLIEKYKIELKNEKDIKIQEIITNKNMYQIEYYRAALKVQEERNNK